MKKIMTCFLCLVLLMACCVNVFACEDETCTHESTTLSTSAVTTGIASDLDQDGDGIPDYMDGCIDIDGDGIQDVDPTYQEPKESVFRKPLSDFQWIMIVLSVALAVVLIITLIHKYFFAKKEEE